MAFDAQAPAEVTQRDRDLIVLEKARKRVARGWWHRQERPGGTVCVWLAISLQFKGGVPVDVSRRMKEALGFTETPGLSEIFDWNDAPGRTQAEVLARFDSAIAALSGQA